MYKDPRRGGHDLEDPAPRPVASLITSKRPHPLALSHRSTGFDTKSVGGHITYQVFKLVSRKLDEEKIVSTEKNVSFPAEWLMLGL